MNANNQDFRQLLEILPFLKEAAFREKPGAATKLAELSNRPDDVGVVALVVHGELLCEFAYPRFNPNLGVEKLASAAGRGSDEAVRKLLAMPVRQASELPRSLRKRWEALVAELKQWNFWLPLLEKRTALDNPTETCLSLVQLLADDNRVGVDPRNLIGFLKSLENRDGFRDRTTELRMARATLMCRDHSGSVQEEGAKMLADMALSGNDEARKVLMGFVQCKERDNRVFVQEMGRFADETGDGFLFFQLGSFTKSDSLPYFQKGALLGSADCQVQVLHLRLTRPLPDLPDARRKIEDLLGKSLEMSSKVLFGSILVLFVKRCSEAIEIDRRILSVCQEARFRDNPAARTVTERFTRLSQWLKWAEKLTPFSVKPDKVQTETRP